MKQSGFKSLSKVSKVLATATLAAGISLANAADTIKVGVLHSLSGTMAISETTLKDTVLMMVEEQNKSRCSTTSVQILEQQARCSSTCWLNPDQEIHS